MHIKTRVLAAVALAAAVPQLLRAADAPAPTAPAGPTLKDVLSTSGIDLHGYIDAAYSYLSGSGLFTSGVADRVFDTEPNSFNVIRVDRPRMDVARYSWASGRAAFLLAENRGFVHSPSGWRPAPPEASEPEIPA